MRGIEWTGERCVPWADDVQVVYEHLHRYRFAASLADGREVVDLGSGEGYGCAILAERAAQVTGVEVDAASVAHASATYHAPNLRFVQASAIGLDDLPNGAADLVTCFELLEHVREQDALLDTCARLLRPDGLLVLSTPDRPAYRAASAGRRNPFHVRELDRRELVALLGAHFPHVGLWGQSAGVGSVMQREGADGDAPAEVLRVRPDGDAWVAASPEPVYLVAVASRAPLPEIPATSSLHDTELTLLRRLHEAAAEARAEAEGAQSRAEGAERDRDQAAEALHAAAQREAAADERERRARKVLRRNERALTAAQAEAEQARREAAEQRSAAAARESSSQERERAAREQIASLTDAERAMRARVEAAESDAAERLRQAEREVVEAREAAEAARADADAALAAAERERAQWAAAPRPGPRDAVMEKAIRVRRALEEAEDQVARLQDAVRAAVALEDALRGELTGHAAAAEGLRAALAESDRLRVAWEAAFRHAVDTRGWKAVQAVRELRDRITRRRADNSAIAALLQAAAPAEPATPAEAAAPPPPAVPAPPPPAVPAPPPPAVPAPSPAPQPAGPAPIAFTPSQRPRVAVVIPVHDHAGLTRNCLAALAANTAHDLLEVIVVDDGSGPEVRAMLAEAEGIAVLRNDRNRGFLHSSARGADTARAEHVCFLNNDTEVRPGWLEALLDVLDADPAVGAVGAKLVYPDGRLQEAGGLLWRDGTGWNVGKGEDPELPEYNHRRDVDYCSAACLVVRRSAFRDVGGFDERFAPGYYEDADLCFALREAGWRVVYQPRSVVVHHEGASHGTDLVNGSGPHTKAAQRANRHIFVAKWGRRLDGHYPPDTPHGRMRGRIERRPRVLVMDTWVPARDKDAGSLRMDWILRLLAERCQVTLFPFNRASVEPYTTELQAAGVEVQHGPMPFAELMRRRANGYDLVVLSRPDVASAHVDEARVHQPAALLAYDTVDLHFVREERRLALAGEEPGPALAEIRRRELSCARRTDVTIAVTRREAELLESCVPGLRTLVVPTIHEVPADAGRPFADRRDLVFVGGFQHPPNEDAMVWFVTDVLPLVRSRIDVRLWVVGSNPTPRLRALESRDVVVTGFVPRLDPYLADRRVFVSPLRFGAGMKGKNGEAMAAGIPLVTTGIGAEGMGLVDGHDALVRDDAAGFADAVVGLYTDEALWRALAANARETVRGRWTPEVVREALDTLIAMPSALARGDAPG